MELESLVGSELAGFRLTRFIGHGGMAAVFRGESTIDDSILRAIKVVRPELASRKEFLARFAEEARILERLQHPNVVRFHGARRDQGYLVMELELLEGQSLSEWAGARLGEPASYEQLTRWIWEASQGAAAAHERGIVHRDLKPDNLFVTADGAIKVLDFGIARAVDEADRVSQTTVAGTVPGSPAYMAPEVCEGAVPSATADVYALGVCMLELGFGYHPLQAPGSAKKSSTQLMFAHVRDDMPSLASKRPDAPAALVRVIERAVSRDPAQRFQSATELAAALEPLLGAAPTPAPVEATPSPATPAASMTEFVLPQLATLSEDPVAGADDAGSEPRLGSGRSPVWRLLGGAAVVVALAAGGWLVMRGSGDEEKDPPKPDSDSEARAADKPTTKVADKPTTKVADKPTTKAPAKGPKSNHERLLGEWTLDARKMIAFDPGLRARFAADPARGAKWVEKLEGGYTMIVSGGTITVKTGPREPPEQTYTVKSQAGNTVVVTAVVNKSASQELIFEFIEDDRVHFRNAHESGQFYLVKRKAGGVSPFVPRGHAKFQGEWKYDIDALLAERGGNRAALIEKLGRGRFTVFEARLLYHSPAVGDMWTDYAVKSQLVNKLTCEDMTIDFRDDIRATMTADGEKLPLLWVGFGPTLLVARFQSLVRKCRACSDSACKLSVLEEASALAKETQNAKVSEEEDERIKSAVKATTKCATAVPPTPPAGYVWLPPGTFTMGTNAGLKPERPAHPVELDGFFLMKAEVTVDEYKKCVGLGVCTADGVAGWGCNAQGANADRGAHPVNCVDHAQATAFCRWAGGRLPTEAEWEYAALSGGRDQTYPWGSARPSCSLAVMDDGGAGCGTSNTSPVCSKPDGRSAQGVCDLMGNVSEWVSDWHGAFTRGRQRNPEGPYGGVLKVTRGSSWVNPDSHLVRSRYRSRQPPDKRHATLGFRCAATNK